jgi:hypothetical protein
MPLRLPRRRSERPFAPVAPCPSIRPTSGSGQKRRCWPCAITSGLPLQADVYGASRHVSKVPLADIRRALTPPANPRERAELLRPRRRSGARNARDRGPRRYSLVAYQAHRHRPALPRAYRRPITASPGTHYRPCDRHSGGRSSCAGVAWNMLKLFVKSCEQSLDRGH